MKKIILLATLFCSSCILSQLCAQSIQNTDWKAFVADPLNDTLTIHIRSDSSFVTNSKGEVLVRSSYTIAGDTLTILDYGTGDYVCPDMKGRYKFIRSGDNLAFTLIDDPCEGRAQTLNGSKWTKALK
jgi:hypothetical protein